MKKILWLLLLGISGLLVSSVSAKSGGQKPSPPATAVAFSPAAGPNLLPYKPTDWSDKLVVSRETGTNADSSSLSATDTLYVDFAVGNNGTAGTTARFYVELYLDGALNHSWYVEPSLDSGYYAYVEDYALGKLAAGTHSLRVKADSTNAIAEGDETDNEYVKSFTVGGGGGGGACVADSRTLCLNNGRFRVQVSFQTPSIPDGSGSAVPLTGDTGYFWFFSSGNVELAIKVLDGRAYNNKFWVFYGALSDVAYTITVTDTATGAVKTYVNPSGRLASVADTSAFAGIRAPGESGSVPASREEYLAAMRSDRPFISILPNLTPYKPASWSDKIVVSKETGTSADSGSFSPTDTLYVDWAIVNNGAFATAARFNTELYVDGTLRATWYTDPPLEANYYAYVDDYSIGSLPAGTHTLRIRTDSGNTVAESDETDNEFTKTITVGSVSTASCVADSRTLCLNGGRYQVQVVFQTAQIPNGAGNAVPLTGDSGYFWFFSSGNVELIVKALDGRAFNDKYWIFYGALSDVAYTIIVTDTVTGEVKIYANPAGNLASVADAAAFPLPAGAPIAHFEIDHSTVGELVLALGVGDPANPAYSLPVANRAAATRANLIRDVDLRLCAAALPPAANSKWYLQAEDGAGGNAGQIRVFRITSGGQTWTAGDTPVPIRDLQKSWSWIPSGVNPNPTPTPTPGPGANHAPVLDRLDSTRYVHSFGRDDALRSEGLGGRPGIAAISNLIAPRVITLDLDRNGQPDDTSPIVLAAANLPSCCTLLVAEGASDPDNDALVYHWSLVTGTFYATGADGAGGLAYGDKVTNLDTYNRNSVFYELPSIGNVIVAHELMGGATSPGVFVTDVRPVPSQSLPSATKYRQLEWGRTIHLEVSLLEAKPIPAGDPTYPDGIEMTLFANIVGSFLANTLPTFRVEALHPEGRTIFDQGSTANGARFTLRFKKNEKGSTVQIAVVATAPVGTFVKPAVTSTPILDFWRSRGCTIGDVDVEKIEAKLGPQSIDVWDSGASADDAFDLIVDTKTLGRTPPGGDRLFTDLLLTSGTHNLCVVYVDCSFCDGQGTYSVRLNGGLTFPDNTTMRAGNLNPSNQKPTPPYTRECFDFKVP